MLKEELSNRLTTSDRISFVTDGLALLWVISRPKKGTVSDYISRFKFALIPKLQLGDVHLVFDRYYPFSTKDGA